MQNKIIKGFLSSYIFNNSFLFLNIRLIYLAIIFQGLLLSAVNKYFNFVMGIKIHQRDILFIMNYK